MVRFIIQFLVYHNNIVDAFYIPIWLDLLLLGKRLKCQNRIILHSNMVRFIIQIQKFMELLMRAFTFQYG